MARRERMLTDEQWAMIEPLIPPFQRSGKGGPKPVENRDALEGILWILRSGARWKDLPDHYPSPSTCWRRLNDWEEQGIFVDVWHAFLDCLEEKGVLDWEEVFVDGSFVPAKKGATASGRPNGVRVRSGWWWRMAKEFLWHAGPRLPRPRK